MAPNNEQSEAGKPESDQPASSQTLPSAPGAGDSIAAGSASPVEEAESPELVIGLIGAVGTDLRSVAAALEHAFETEAAYAATTIRLADLLREIVGLAAFTPDATEEVRYDESMRAGTALRQKLGQGDAMARLGIMAIREIRKRLTSGAAPVTRRAFVLHSLKRREEVQLLREVYGPAFAVVAACTPRHQRVQNLATRIAFSHAEFNELHFREDAEKLVNRDEEEREEKLGQNLRAAFPEADVFIDASDPQRMQQSVHRFVRLLFGFPYHTPTRDEHGMFHARAAALRSSALGRQVGSAIATRDGDIVAVGTNEAPKPFGGLYWEGDTPDGRDFVLSHDVSDRQKQDVLRDALTRLQEGGWLVPPYNDLTGVQLVRAALGMQGAASDTTPALKGARAMDAIEFMRPVHAEMAALMDAARRGAPVGGQTMYVTTFPCHECARHLIAVGLVRVVYIDPYPKSLAAALYADSIAVDGEDCVSGTPQKVPFVPFVGVAPRRYFEVFEMRGDRKTKEGATIPWEPATAAPRGTSDSAVYSITEESLIVKFRTGLDAAGLSMQ